MTARDHDESVLFQRGIAGFYWAPGSWQWDGYQWVWYAGAGHYGRTSY